MDIAWVGKATCYLVACRYLGPFPHSYGSDLFSVEKTRSGFRFDFPVHHICSSPTFYGTYWFKVVCSIPKLILIRKRIEGVPWWPSGLRVCHCHHCGSGYSCGVGFDPCPGISICNRCDQKRKKKKKKEKKKKKKKLTDCKRSHAMSSLGSLFLPCIPSACCSLS